MDFKSLLQGKPEKYGVYHMFTVVRRGVCRLCRSVVVLEVVFSVPLISKERDIKGAGWGLAPLPEDRVEEDDMLVKTILKAKARGAGVVTISPDSDVAQAARILAEHRIGALVAVEADGRLAGILSERDIVRGVGQGGAVCLSGPVRGLMTATVLTCTEDDTVESLMQTMTSRRIRHLPVVDGDGRLCGIVTIGDVVKSRLDQADMEVDNLRHYVVAAR